MICLVIIVFILVVMIWLFVIGIIVWGVILFFVWFFWRFIGFLLGVCGLRCGKVGNCKGGSW